jgi:hypothetical protein
MDNKFWNIFASQVTIQLVLSITQQSIISVSTRCYALWHLDSYGSQGNV